MLNTRRGRPPLLTMDDEERITQLLEAVAGGTGVKAAAAELGLSLSPVYRLRRQNRRFRDALTVAVRAGRSTRMQPVKHGTESTYVNRGCRCERCVPAAAAARAGRKQGARGGRESSG
ncbi:hypothetical protein [Kitasatospora sp. NPDC087315]|uniref:hypothetical protein n=1 Tax=Kitasatospora sp. NPDC087315 TaxID=3364069 RepID=UPI003808BBE4